MIVRGLHGRRVLDGVELDLEPGRLVAIVGDRGTGKSTLLEALAGVLPLEAGRPVLRAGLALSPPPLPAGIDAATYLGAFGVGVPAALEAVGLASKARVDRRSAWKLEVARALVAGPDLLLVDDALDWPDEDFEQLRPILRAVASAGRSVVVTGGRADRAQALEGADVRVLAGGRLHAAPIVSEAWPTPPTPRAAGAPPAATFRWLAWAGLELRLTARRVALHAWALVLVGCAMAAVLFRYRNAYGGGDPGRDLHLALGPILALATSLATVHAGGSIFAQDRADLPIALVRLTRRRGAVWSIRLGVALVRTAGLVALAAPLLLLGHLLGGPTADEVARTLGLVSVGTIASLSIAAFGHAFFRSSTSATLLADLLVLTAANFLARHPDGVRLAPFAIPASAILLLTAGSVERRMCPGDG